MIAGVAASSSLTQGSALLLVNFREYDCKPHGIDLASIVAGSVLAARCVDVFQMQG